MKRPPVSRCIVVAYDGGDDRMAGVVVGRRGGDLRSVLDTAPTAPESVAASLMLKRSEMKTAPEAEPLGVAHLGDEVPGDPARARQRVEAEPVERHGPDSDDSWST